MRRTLALAIVAATALLAACNSTPTTEEAAENLCGSLASFESSVQAALGIGLSTTAEDAQDTLDDVGDAWQDVKDDAEVVNESATVDAQDALDAFREAIDDIPEDGTIEQSLTAAVTALQDLGTALSSISGSITCG